MTSACFILCVHCVRCLWCWCISSALQSLPLTCDSCSNILTASGEMKGLPQTRSLALICPSRSRTVWRSSRYSSLIPWYLAVTRTLVNLTGRSAVSEIKSKQHLCNAVSPSLDFIHLVSWNHHVSIFINVLEGLERLDVLWHLLQTNLQKRQQWMYHSACCQNKEKRCFKSSLFTFNSCCFSLASSAARPWSCGSPSSSARAPSAFSSQRATLSSGAGRLTSSSILYSRS